MLVTFLVCMEFRLHARSKLCHSLDGARHVIHMVIHTELDSAQISTQLDNI